MPGGLIKSGGLVDRSGYPSPYIETMLDDADAATALATLGAAPLAAPVFTGDPRAPTPPVGDNDTSLATTAYVQAGNFGLWTPAQNNLKAASCDPTFASSVSAFNNTDLQMLVKIPIPVQITVGNIEFYIGASTGTLTRFYATLYTIAGSLFATTGEISASANTLGLKAPALSVANGGSLTIPAGYVYASFQASGAVSLQRISQAVSAAVLNRGLALSDGYRSAVGPGSTTTPPNTLGALTIENKLYYVGLY